MRKTNLFLLIVVLLTSCTSGIKCSIDTKLFSQVSYIEPQSYANQNTLSNIALNDENVDVRKLAVEKLTNQNTLSSVAMNDENGEIRKLALKRLN